MEKKKRFQMPSTFTTIGIILIAVALLTWVIPGGAYDYVDPNAAKLQPIAGSYHAARGNPQNLFDILQAPINGFYNSVDIILYTLIIGGFMAIVLKTGAIDAGIGKILKKLNGREKLLIPILMCLFALGGVTFGMMEETLPFFPVVIPIFLAAGYDTLTAIGVVKIGAVLGCMASFTNPFAIVIASKFAGISIGDGILVRAVLLILYMPVGIFFVMRYAEKVRRDPTKSLVYDLSDEMKQKFLGNAGAETLPEFTAKRKIVLVLFALTFIIMLWGIIPFSEFGITFIPTLNWWFGELATVFMTGAIVIGIFAGFSEKEIIKTFMDGARGLLEVAVIIGVARGISVLMNDAMITDTILHEGEMVLQSVSSAAFAIATYVFYFLFSFILGSSSGLATLTMNITAPLADFAGVARHIVVTAFSSANTLVTILSPACGILMGVLAMCDVTLDRWYKYIGKMVAVLILISLVVIAIASIL